MLTILQNNVSIQRKFHQNQFLIEFFRSVNVLLERLNYTPITVLTTEIAANQPFSNIISSYAGASVFGPIDLLYKNINHYKSSPNSLKESSATSVQR